ncbi:MAG: ferrous iron transport protein B [Candidatus Latescibacterota bacterium]|jgi:ferrous iron transport protein B
MTDAKSTRSAVPTLALIGNPNTGKTTLFNALTGLSQQVGNYPGVTVERKIGALQHSDGRSINIVDLPGTYSLSAHSPDEAIAVDALISRQQDLAPIDGVLCIVDAANIRRNFYLLSQLVEAELPIVIALNMIDIAETRAIIIDAEKLSQRLGLPVVPVCAHRRQGLDTLRKALENLVDAPSPALPSNSPELPVQIREGIEQLQEDFTKTGRSLSYLESLRTLIDDDSYLEERLVAEAGDGFARQLKTLRQQIFTDTDPGEFESQTRYTWIDALLSDALQQPDELHSNPSDRIDGLLTHRFFGIAAFALLNAFVFQAIYSWSGPLMDIIEGLFATLGGWVGSALPVGPVQSLLVDGVLAGVGGVLIFLPQIAILFLFISLLEDCGYMARAALLMDRLLTRCGLSGKSFIPLLSSFACAVPGIMATRTIEDRRDRLATILVAPLMSCSARLPVYILFIAAFVPERTWAGGLFNLQGMALLAFYALGILVAIPMAFLLKKTLLKGEAPPFLLELPSYKWPEPRNVLLRVYQNCWAFVVRAGSIILATTIAMWALAYFPRDEQITEQFERERAALESAGQTSAAAFNTLDSRMAAAQIEASYLGRAGHLLEPLVRPLGWDWRIGMAVVASFPAREVVISALGTIYSLGGDQDEESEDLRTAMRRATWPDGRPVFTLPVALSIMVFFALCAQCLSTLVVIQRETGSWGWSVFSFSYMTALAYIAALLTYQIGTALGWGI